MSSAGMNPMALSAQYSEIPNEITSSERKKPIPMSVRQVAVATQSGSAVSGGQLNFQISSANGFIKPNSVYIKCRIALTNSGGNAVANTIVAFGNACRNASSIIERFTVSSGNQIESINNYGSSYVPTLLLHCSNRNYKDGDDVLMEGSFRGQAGWNAGSGTAIVGTAASAQQNAWVDLFAGQALNLNSSIDVCIPLYSNLFSNEKAYPLCLLSQATNISLDLATFGKAFYCTEGYTEFTVSQAQICYDLLQVNADYLMALKGQMAQGMLYSIPFTSVMSSQFAKQGNSTTISWGLGLSSLKGVTFSGVQNPTTLADAKYLISDCSVGTQAGNNTRLFLDGMQQSAVVVDTSAARYASQQQVFGLLTDVGRSVVSGGIITYGATNYQTNAHSYDNHFYVGGQACHKVAENLAMTGSQCNQLSLIIETNQNVATVLYCNAWHDRLMVIDANGSANIVL
jgi:hypothetical protein